LRVRPPRRSLSQRRKLRDAYQAQKGTSCSEGNLKRRCRAELISKDRFQRTRSDRPKWGGADSPLWGITVR
jgi:hypothetical protein